MVGRVSGNNKNFLGLIVSAKDNILTNSLTSNSHSTKTVLSIDVYLNTDDCNTSEFIFVVFRISVGRIVGLLF